MVASFYRKNQTGTDNLDRACFDGKDFGRFDDIDSITMFADYR